MSDSQQEQNTTNQDRDEQIVLMYLSFCHSFEQALVRAGFARVGNVPGVVLADWKKFALHIEGKFDQHETKGLKMAVDHLRQADNNVDLHNKWLDRRFAHENGLPHEIVWLAELIQHTRLTVIDALNFPKEQGYDTTQIMSAMFVVEKWWHLDPKVESLLGTGM